MAGKRELFISIAFSLLAVSHSICVPCSVKMAMESQSHQATSNTSTTPSNSSETYTSTAVIESESPVGTSESYSTASNTYSVSQVNTALPVTTAIPATLNETLIFTEDKSSNVTTPDNANAVIVDSSSVGSSAQANSAYVAEPWMKLSRMTREEERGESEITDSNSIGELKEADAERVSFVTEGSASAWQTSEEELNDKSDSPESDGITDDTQNNKNNENIVERTEDRFGAVYPYLYRQEFLREKFWPIYRKHPYNSYIRYPIFPGK